MLFIIAAAEALCSWMHYRILTTFDSHYNLALYSAAHKRSIWKFSENIVNVVMIEKKKKVQDKVVQTFNFVFIATHKS